MRSVRLPFSVLAASCLFASLSAAEQWPDGSRIDESLLEDKAVDVTALGREYRLDVNYIFPDGETHTREIQDLIDRASSSGGGVIVVPPGVYRTGSLFFRPKVNLRLLEGAVLQGSDNPNDYPIVDTRIESKTRKFVAALINAENCDGFTVVGPGTIDGNGYRSWISALRRLQWCPTASNLDGQRARILYVAHSKGVRVENVRLQNPQFWTQHYWDCDDLRLVDVRVYSPTGPKGHVKSCTDGLDLDETRNVLVRRCSFTCYDDGIALKSNDGNPVGNLLIEDCAFGRCHGALVLGSEARHVRNVLMRRCRVESSSRILWIKFRNDMAQHYEYVTVEDVSGTVERFFFARQFSDSRDLKGLPEGVTREMMRSRADHFTMRRCQVECREFFHMSISPLDGQLSDFVFADLNVRGENIDYDRSKIERCAFDNVQLEKIAWTGARNTLAPIIRPSSRD